MSNADVLTLSATVLSAHTQITDEWVRTQGDGSLDVGYCGCGSNDFTDHARHQAEQLSIFGLLAMSSPYSVVGEIHQEHHDAGLNEVGMQMCACGEEIAPYSDVRDVLALHRLDMLQGYIDSL